MNIVCLDLEGVLVPEIWIAFAEASGIPALRRTTRDEPDYDKLMRWRLEILKEHGLGLLRNSFVLCLPRLGHRFHGGLIVRLVRRSFLCQCCCRKQ